MKNLESQTKTSEVRIINRLQDMERETQVLKTRSNTSVKENVKSKRIQEQNMKGIWDTMKNQIYE